ncbi:MAG TPA: hypothetical protein VGN64_03845 [Dyadobacter sp.]|jgi:hypothetical protein|nr:hypothetical protein [Dyadobacter sp.]
MNFNIVKTILLSLSLGFFVVWILEFRRAGMFESYWLLLLSVMCLLVFQFRRLKASLEMKKKQAEEIEAQKLSASKTAKK